MLTTAQQIEIAIAVHAKIGNEVTIDGERFDVARWAMEIRFFERPRRVGVVGRSAHVAIIRHDLAKWQILPMPYQNPALAAQCEAIVTAALA